VALASSCPFAMQRPFAALPVKIASTTGSK
jgi:hypothetical protein